MREQGGSSPPRYPSLALRSGSPAHEDETRGWYFVDSREIGHNEYYHTREDAEVAAYHFFNEYYSDFIDEHDIPDNEADAQVLAMVGWGTAEDYGCYWDDYDMHYD